MENFLLCPPAPRSALTTTSQAQAEESAMATTTTTNNNDSKSSNAKWSASDDARLASLFDEYDPVRGIESIAKLMNRPEKYILKKLDEKILETHAHLVRRCFYDPKEEGDGDKETVEEGAKFQSIYNEASFALCQQQKGVDESRGRCVGKVLLPSGG